MEEYSFLGKLLGYWSPPKFQLSGCFSISPFGAPGPHKMDAVAFMAS